MNSNKLNLIEKPTTTKEWLSRDAFITTVRVPPKQLLKWIGNKQRFASQIAAVFPKSYKRYIEPFVGSGAVLGAMAPEKGLAGDTLKPLIDTWLLLKNDPDKLYQSYKKNWEKFINNPKATYKEILDSYNKQPNPLDFVFLSRSCYGGVVRFTKEGKMSTPVGPHKPISPDSFKERMILWRSRIKNSEFVNSPYQATLEDAGDGDIIYCDPPYTDSQTILYGAQTFRLSELFEIIQKCKNQGAKIALSIDGHKKSGTKIIELNIPIGLFEREILIAGGSSMLRRFQKKDEAMIGEDVHDRLLLTW